MPDFLGTQSLDNYFNNKLQGHTKLDKLIRFMRKLFTIFSGRLVFAFVQMAPLRASLKTTLSAELNYCGILAANTRLVDVSSWE